MKEKEKNFAIKLRREGLSMGEIAERVGVAKSSISLWVGKIELTAVQRKQLSLKSRSKDSIEKRRASRLANESTKRQLVIDAARREITPLSKKELWLSGIMLYWAEGGKTQRMVRFSNSDPEMIKIMMAFFRRVCGVPEEKFRGHIHIHPHLDHKKSEKFWSGVSGIPLRQFYKTYRKMNVASKHKRDNLPLGTFDVYAFKPELFLKISGWAQGVFRSY